MEASPATNPSSITDRIASELVTGNEELFERARAVIPGGVDSPVRAFGSVGGTPAFSVAFIPARFCKSVVIHSSP